MNSQRRLVRALGTRRRQLGKQNASKVSQDIIPMGGTPLATLLGRRTQKRCWFVATTKNSTRNDMPARPSMEAQRRNHGVEMGLLRLPKVEITVKMQCHLFCNLIRS